MLKSYLLTPGPTPVPRAIALAMAQPIVHHRSQTFESLFSEIREGLKWLCGTPEEVLTFTCSGTGAMEGAVANFLRRGEKVVVVDGGKFGERWAQIASAYGVVPLVIKVEWGEAVEAAAVEAALDANPDAGAVLFQASESSTGVLHPVEEICALVRRREGVLSIVDAVSALGALDLPVEALGVDVLIGASQKALMLPPGLSFGVASAKAWKRNEAADLPRYYFDWRRERELSKKNQTSFTPAVSLLLGLREVIRLLRAEGKERIFARHDRLARAVRAAMTALGLRLFARRPAPSLTTVVSPVDADKLVKTLRDRYGVTIVGGQDQAKGKIFRIAHLGYVDEPDVLVALSAVERALSDMGHPVALGTGVGAAMQVFSGA